MTYKIGQFVSYFQKMSQTYQTVRISDQASDGRYFVTYKTITFMASEDELIPQRARA